MGRCQKRRLLDDEPNRESRYSRIRGKSRLMRIVLVGDSIEFRASSLEIRQNSAKAGTGGCGLVEARQRHVQAGRGTRRSSSGS